MYSQQFTSAKHISSVLGWEMDGAMSRDSVILAGDANAVRDLPIGTVLGKTLFAAPTAAAAQGNTGNGAVTAVSLVDAKIGTYSLTCIAASAHGGHFAVIDPDGLRLADLSVGTPYLTRQLQATVSAGSADFVVGDSLTIVVAKGDGRRVPLNLAAHDGTQLADSVLLQAAWADVAEDINVSVVARFAEILPDGLVWPAGAADADIAAGLDRLARQTLLARPTA